MSTNREFLLLKVACLLTVSMQIAQFCSEGKGSAEFTQPVLK